MNTDHNALWTAQQSILAYGVHIGLRTNKLELLHRLLEHLPPLWKPSPAVGVDRLFTLQASKSQYELFDNDDRMIKSRGLKIIFQSFERRLKMYVAEMARRRVFVHAGAVGWQGQAIIIPGHSMSGKTSLVKELIQAGATYYSDEYAVLDSKGRVHPYPQPLEIREGHSVKQKKYPVERLGGKTGTRPLPVGLVVFSRYQAEARWRPRKLSAGQTVLNLLNHTVPARRKPEVVFPTLQQSVSQAIALKGSRGEAAETARLILRRMKAKQAS